MVTRNISGAVQRQWRGCHVGRREQCKGVKGTKKEHDEVIRGEKEIASRKGKGE